MNNTDSNFNSLHAFTEKAAIVTYITSMQYLGETGGGSSILCPSHTRKAMADTGAEGVMREATFITGRFVCQECAKFDYNEHAKLVKALKVPGSYTRQRGFNGQIGVVYNTDSTSPSGAMASGTGFDPFCPHATETINEMAQWVAPPRA